MSKTIIFGPPGTGKTTRLLDIVDSCLDSGIPADKICFISFTRKAANEAKGRAMHKFNLPDERLPWFRTLHSLAFQQLGLNRQSVMGIRDYGRICEALGLTLTYKGISDDGTFTGLSLGDRLLFMENMARATLKDLKAYWELQPDEDIYWYELSRLSETLRKYKKEQVKWDFTDMVTAFVNNVGAIPPISILIVDEAQDLSPLQWKMVDRLSTQAEEVYIAGDDDQAIFRWAGADVEHLMTMEADRTVLHQSYRCSQAVWAFADRLVKRIKQRVEKAYLPTKDPGLVTQIDDLSHLALDKGTWLLLARNSHFLEQYAAHCVQRGLLFEAATDSIISRSTLETVRIWEYLRTGKKIPVIQARKVYDLLTPKIGVQYGFKAALDRVVETQLVDIDDLKRVYGLMVNGPWNDALDKIPVVERQYLQLALSNGESLAHEARIKISTIHGVKGGEAENVVLLPDMATRTQKEYEHNHDDEHRVWYVGATRARHNLYVLSPISDRFYDLWS